MSTLRYIYVLIAPPQEHKVDRSFVLAGCSYGGRHLPRIFLSEGLHIISVLASETVSTNAEHAATITVIILSSPSGDRDTMSASSAFLSSPSGDRDTMSASSAYRVLHNSCASSSCPPRPSDLPAGGLPSRFYVFRWSCTILSMMGASGRKRVSATCSTAVINMNSNGASTHP